MDEASAPSPGPRLSEEAARWLADGVTRSVLDYAIFLLDPEGRIMTWSAAAQRIKGWQPAEIIGRSFKTFYPKDAIDSRWPERELEMAARDGRFEDENWRLRKNGSRFWANVIITAIRDDAGTLRGFLKITRDLTERRRGEEALRQSEERFRLLIDSVHDYAMILLDDDGRVISWNSGAERLFGFDRAEILGQPSHRFHPAGEAATELLVARDRGRFEEEGWRLRKGGTHFWASLALTALRRPDGRRHGFAAVVRDLTQRRRVEALEAAGRETSEFLAMLAHELRNPLAPVRNALEVMRGASAGEKERAWSHAVIERQIAHLSRLVDDLLDVSRITAGKIRLRTEAVNLAATVGRAVDEARPQFEARRQRLELTLEGQPVVRGDVTRLSQVVMNLLSNAGRYTPEGGHINVRVCPAAGLAEIRVKDDGIGMKPELRERVFELFAQGDRALDRTEGGLGIGLTLVRQLVHLHGGEVEARSEGPGRGSEFVVRLPVIEPEPAGGEDAAVDEAPSSRDAVLVVDDNRDSADTMARLLEMWGHRVSVAYDGEEAVRKAEEERPGVVLLDLGLPKLDGFEAARRMRARPELAGLRILAMSGYGQEEDVRRTREAGFDDHLVKPVDLATLRQRMAATPSSPPA